jgi:hypothetical protein
MDDDAFTLSQGQVYIHACMAQMGEKLCTWYVLAQQRHRASACTFSILVYRDKLPASAFSANHVKVVAKFRRQVWVNRLHKVLKDHPAAIGRKQAELLVRHGQRTTAAAG